MTTASDRAEGLAGQHEPVRFMGAQRLNIAVGNFCFRYRNALFPCIFLLMVLLMRPAVILGRPGLDRLLVTLGALVALAGELLRLTTIGFEYIERGGKAGRVYASRLVQGGTYGQMRNPMYVGNALIAIGMAMVTGSPTAYLLIIPLFLFIYQAIVSAEEAYLRGKFGEEYEAYCARVNRFVPSLRGLERSFAGMRYNWQRALRQDLSTIAGLLMGLTLLPLWRTYFLEGWRPVTREAPRTGAVALGVMALYALMVCLKKQRRLEDRPR